jgi:5-methylcytosine-specific restriction endonuclease McrA
MFAKARTLFHSFGTGAFRYRNFNNESIGLFIWRQVNLRYATDAGRQLDRGWHEMHSCTPYRRDVSTTSEAHLADDHQRFPASIQRLALSRQSFRCASCGTMVIDIGEAGRANHTFDERAEGHHVIPHKMGGPITVENCVVLCRACHLNAHQGGRWRDVSIYADLARLSMDVRIARIASEYPHYRG